MTKLTSKQGTKNQLVSSSAGRRRRARPHTAAPSIRPSVVDLAAATPWNETASSPSPSPPARRGHRRHVHCRQREGVPSTCRPAKAKGALAHTAAPYYPLGHWPVLIPGETVDGNTPAKASGVGRRRPRVPRGPVPEKRTHPPPRSLFSHSFLTPSLAEMNATGFSF